MKRNNNFNKLKTALAAVLVSCLALVTHAQVTLPHYDSLDHITGRSLSSKPGWTVLNSGDSLLIVDGNLSYANLPASAGGKKVTFDGAGIDARKEFTQQTSDTTFYSLIFKVTSLGSLGATPGYSFGFIESTTSTFGAAIWFRANGAGYDIGFSPRTNVNLLNFSGPYNLGDSIFVVVGYKIVAGTNNDTAMLWINPDYTSFGASTPPPPSIKMGNNTLQADLANVNCFLVRQALATTTPFIEFDELRLGTSWADVAPAGVVRPNNPSSFAANAASGTQINLSWALNGASDSVLVVYNNDNVFSVPTDGAVYTVGGTIGAGDNIIYKGLAAGFNHTGLTSETQYFYKAWSFNASHVYSTGITANATTWDVTAPTFIGGYPAAANVGGTSFDLQVQLNEPGTAYYLVLADGSPAPSVADVLAGQSINIPAANTTYTANVNTGINPLTAYDVYFVAQDDFTTLNTQSATTLVELTTLSSDLVPPVFVDGFPAIVNISYNQFDIDIQLDEAGTAFYLILPDGSPAPSVNDVKSGDTLVIPADSITYSVTISGLTEATPYDVYVVAQDDEASPNVQATITLVEATTAAGPAGDLFFSEYIEGSSNNKAFEIFNGTGYPVDLSQYSLKLGTNGAAWSTTVTLNGMLDNNDVYIVSHASAAQAILDLADTTSTICYFNGDDAVGLFKNGNLIDVIGQYLNDPGTAWPVAGIPNATAEHTLVRKNSITTGDTSWTNSAGTDSLSSQWLVLAQNEFNYLGWHRTPPDDTIPPVFISGYPNTSNVTINSFNVNVQLNKSGKAYIYVQNDGLPAPSVNTIITNGDSLNVVNANTTYTKAYMGLTQGTAYDVYVIARNLNFYYQNTHTLLDVTTLIPDTVAPVFNPTFPKITALNNNTATLAVSMDESGIAYYLLLADGAPAPTRAQVMAGTAIPVAAANTVYNAYISGLTLNTAYDLYVIAKDAYTTPNVQDTTTLVEFANIDTLAPQYNTGYPILNNIKATMMDLVVQLNETGKLYFKVMADGSPAPTINQILSSDSVAITAANNSFTRTITGLTPLTAYDVYAIAKDTSGNVQTASTLLEATTLNMDVTPPAFTATYPKVDNIIYTAATFKAAINEPGMVYFKLQSDGTPAPTINQVMANDSIAAPTANVEVMRLLSGLNEQTAYDLYVIARDNADIPNIQSTLTLVEFATPAQPTGELFFSEYIEGSSNNKALELYNPTGATMDLSAYSLKLGTNGAAWSTTLNLTGNLNAGDVYVIAHASAAPEILALADVTSTICYFNGDDAVGLFKNGVLIDVIGQYLNDPGTAWPVAGVANATAEHTLVRKPFVMNGDTSWSSSAGTDSINSQWLVYPQNTFNFLGWHNETSSKPVISGVGTQPNAPVALDSVRVVATVTDDSAVATVLCRWGLNAGNLNNTLPMTLVSVNNYHTVNKIPPHATGTTVYYRVCAWDNSANSDSSVVMNYTVIDTASLTNIYTIQYTTDPSGNSSLVGQQVKTQGVVTAVLTGTTKAYFIQEGAGEWNGIYVYENVNTPAVGDLVIVRGTVTEYNGLTELINITYFQIVNTGNPLPAAEEISIGDMGESYESVLISFDSVKCINANAGFGMWTIKDAVTNDSLRVDDNLYLFAPTLNKFYDVKGIGYYSFSEFKILPRNASDIVECVSIKEFDAMNYSIYPNPATQSITIGLPNGQNYGISIIDALGKVVYKSDNAVSGQINLQHLSKGIYTFMVIDAKTQQTASKKLIVQ